MTLFNEEDRKMVKGVIINKFRGDKTILQPGLDKLEELINVPTVGVVPYLHVDIDDEDSLTERFSRKGKVALIDIAVIRLPRISNFTDFNVFEYSDAVGLRYVDSAAQLGNPDLIIIPGTKNTMEDLLWMRQNGLEAAIIKYAAAGKPLFGICGGFQMLGKVLEDPYHVEHGGSLKGMGLLPCKTVFEKEKTRTQIKGHFETKGKGFFAALEDVEVEGYEIHMGQTAVEESEQNKVDSLTRITEISEEKVNQTAGLCSDNVYGSYIHGIFDKENVVKTIVSILLKNKGLDESAVSGLDVKAYKERQYDLLADGLRENMDIKTIYRILNEGV